MLRSFATEETLFFLRPNRRVQFIPCLIPGRKQTLSASMITLAPLPICRHFTFHSRSGNERHSCGKCSLSTAADGHSLPYRTSPNERPEHVRTSPDSHVGLLRENGYFGEATRESIRFLFTNYAILHDILLTNGNYLREYGQNIFSFDSKSQIPMPNFPLCQCFLRQCSYQQLNVSNVNVLFWSSLHPRADQSLKSAFFSSASPRLITLFSNYHWLIFADL